MGDLETTVAAPFIHIHQPTLSQMKLIFYFTQDKHWMRIDEAKNLISFAVSIGYYQKKESGEFTLTETLKSVKIPQGYKPNNETIKITAEILQGIREKNKDFNLSEELQEIKTHFDNNIDETAALIIIARKYRVDISPYRETLIKTIENCRN